MYLEEKGYLIFCKWDLFKQYKNLTAVFSTRKGGFSPEPYDSLNMGLTTDDKNDTINHNRSLFFDTLSISQANTAKMSQVHSDTVKNVGEAGDTGNCDGMVSDTSNVFLCGTFADCAAVIVFDPQRKAVGLFHVGWRGLASEIARKGVEKIIRTYGVDPCTLLVGISPHIKSCCFEVGKDVSCLFGSSFFTENGGDRGCLSIEDIIINQLCNIGVKRENIERSAYCTSCDNELFFSHRKNKGKTGRMMAVVGIIE